MFINLKHQKIRHRIGFLLKEHMADHLTTVCSPNNQHCYTHIDFKPKSFNCTSLCIKFGYTNFKLANFDTTNRSFIYILAEEYYQCQVIDSNSINLNFLQLAIRYLGVALTHYTRREADQEYQFIFLKSLIHPYTSRQLAAKEAIIFYNLLTNIRNYLVYFYL